LVTKKKKNLFIKNFFFKVYSAAIQEANNVLYDGLIEELVEVLNVRDSTLTVCLEEKKENMKSIFIFIGYKSISFKNFNINNSS
jgi:hypothetical protein